MLVSVHLEQTETRKGGRVPAVNPPAFASRKKEKLTSHNHHSGHQKNAPNDARTVIAGGVLQ